jgi:hypothetical protein
VLGLVAVASVGVFLFAPLPAAEEAEVAELPEPFTRPDPDELREQGFIDVGPLLAVEGGGDVVLGHSMRDLFTALATSGTVRFVGGYQPGLAGPGNPSVAYLGDASIFDSASKTVRVADGQSLTVRAEWFPASDGDPLPLIAGARRSRILVSAGATGGAVHRVTITRDGHGWVDPEPLDEDAVYDEWTGQQLDLGSAVPVG